MKFKILALIFYNFFLLNACTVVKPYQKAQLNDIDMELSSYKIDSPCITFHSYREGSVGANGGKTGGGCGCN